MNEEKELVSYKDKILVCIYTCKKDRNSLEKLKSTDWYKHISNEDNFNIINVLADQSIEQEYNLNNNTLTLNTEESYNNLSIKTYKMIESCIKIFDFDFLLKIDGNIIEGRHNKTSMLFSFEYFLEKFYHKGIVGEYNGLTPIVDNSIQQFRRWANLKRTFVMPEALISDIGQEKWPINYWAGNCYCLGKQSINKILKQEKLFIKFKNLMGGCEDMAIASALL